MLLLLTSAELELMKDMRTKEYQKTIKWAQDNAKDYNVVWLECVSNREPSYLKSAFPCFCSNIHNPSYQNQGSNHGKALKEFFNMCDFDDDFVIQTTGRYHFIDTHFFETIKNNPGYDVYVKSDGHDQYFTGCFGMKKEYLIQWVNETDWDELNSMMLNFEKSLWNFVKQKDLNVFEVDEIHLDCNVFGKGNLVRVIQ